LKVTFTSLPFLKMPIDYRCKYFYYFGREWMARISTKLCHMFGNVSYQKTQSKLCVFSHSKTCGPRTAYFGRLYDDIYERISSEWNAL